MKIKSRSGREIHTYLYLLVGFAKKERYQTYKRTYLSSVKVGKRIVLIINDNEFLHSTFNGMTNARYSESLVKNNDQHQL